MMRVAIQVQALLIIVVLFEAMRHLFEFAQITSRHCSDRMTHVAIQVHGLLMIVVLFEVM